MIKYKRMPVIPGAPYVLDLYCGAGGASMGYYQAGFNVVGVDLYPMPRYPFPFIQADAIQFLDDTFLSWMNRDCNNYGFIAIHASPPCQQWSNAMNCQPDKVRNRYPALIEPTRERLEWIGLPYIIENVPPAPLIDPVILCGCQFGLTVKRNGEEFQLRRTRAFEVDGFSLPDPGPHNHDLPSFPVFGHGPGGGFLKRHPGQGGKGQVDAQRELMGIPWANREELAEAIPPAFTRYISEHLIKEIGSEK